MDKLEPAGELFVGRVFEPPEGQTWQAEAWEEAKARGVEILEGREAEDLIARLTLPLRLQPGRQEALYLEASDGTRSVTAMRKIVRPGGRAPYLERLEQCDSSSGRFANMLINPPTIQ